jgi:hypothetical protein
LVGTPPRLATRLLYTVATSSTAVASQNGWIKTNAAPSASNHLHHVVSTRAEELAQAMVVPMEGREDLGREDLGREDLGREDLLAGSVR